MLRRATADDASDLFAWRNDEITRAMSISTDRVSWQDHIAWLDRSLVDRDRLLYVAEDSGRKVGSCRFDIDGNCAEISITLAPSSRGQGLSVKVVRAAIEVLRLERPDVQRLTATIRPTNAASIRCFTSAGFARRSSDGQFDHYERRL